MPVRSRTLMSVACLASAARTAISHVGVSIWVSAVGFRLLLVRQYSCPYRTRRAMVGQALPPANARLQALLHRSAGRFCPRAILGYGVLQPLASHHRIRFSVS